MAESVIKNNKLFKRYDVTSNIEYSTGTTTKNQHYDINFNAILVITCAAKNGSTDSWVSVTNHSFGDIILGQSVDHSSGRFTLTFPTLKGDSLDITTYNLQSLKAYLVEV